MQAFIGNSQKTNNRRTILSRQKFFLANCRVGHPPVTTGPSETKGQRTTPTHYRGSPPYAFFGTWKKPCYMKLVLVGLYCGPLLTLIPPLTRT